QPADALLSAAEVLAQARDQGGQLTQSGLGVVMPGMLLSGTVDLAGAVTVRLVHREPSFRHQPASLRPPEPRLITSTAAAAPPWALGLPAAARSCPARRPSPAPPPCADDSRSTARCSLRSPS